METVTTVFMIPLTITRLWAAALSSGSRYDVGQTLFGIVEVARMILNGRCEAYG
jgi:hypothetical protein